MSRLGLKPISLPAGVEVKVDSHLVTVKGAKGEVSVPFGDNVSVEVKDGALQVSNLKGEGNKQAAMDHGTIASHLRNAVKGVSEGWKVELEIAGTGYRAQKSGNNVTLYLGYSHNITVSPVGKYTTIEVPKETIVEVHGCNRQEVGQTAALIYDWRRPDVYANKGVHYKGQHMIKKVGKRATAGKK